MSKPVKCPKCGGDSLSVLEVHEEWGSTDFGCVYRDENGNITTPSDFVFTPGDPIKAWLQCECGHEWKPRKATVSSTTSEEFEQPVVPVDALGFPTQVGATFTAIVDGRTERHVFRVRSDGSFVRLNYWGNAAGGHYSRAHLDPASIEDVRPAEVTK